MTEHLPRWLAWAREIQALAQIGEAYSENQWQSRRYRRLMEISAEIIAEHADLEKNSVFKDFCSQLGYATPKVDVRGAVFRDDRLLMVRERLDNCWTMPGGWAEVGDTPSEAIEREVWEESGFRVKCRKVVGVYDANRIEPLDLYHAFKLVFLCDIVGGEAKVSDETAEVTFFALDEIPENLSVERTKIHQVHDAFAAHENRSQPCIFD
jgi:ADP-ribose pyrophosphatase YjhB (NUDIX family)